MVAKEYTSYKPNYAIHPGEYLEEVLAERKMTQKELAELTGYSKKHLNQIIKKKAALSAETALRFEKVLDISADIWNTLENNYRLFEARKKEDEELQKNLLWIKQFPVRDLQTSGFIPKTEDGIILIRALLVFFGIAGVEQWDNYSEKSCGVYCRKSNNFDTELNDLLCWIRIAEIKSQQTEIKPYSEKAFKSNIEVIRSLTNLPVRNVISEMTRLCALSGVVFVVLPEIGKARISGITKWQHSDRILLALSDRYKTGDQFWFSFFHEAAHILLHSKEKIFIESDKSPDSDYESEANQFAENKLIPPELYHKFVKTGDFSANCIYSFSEKLSIHPGILVGRLQHDHTIAFNKHNELKEKISL